jgi:hypothetical protein
MSKLAKKSNIAFPNQGHYKYKVYDFPKKDTIPNVVWI